MKKADLLIENGLLKWRIATALKASCLENIDSPQELMEMILKGHYDERRDQALLDSNQA